MCVRYIVFTCDLCSCLATGGPPQLLCPDLTSPRWGRVDVRYDSENELFMATYSCDEGRGLNGDRNRYCLRNNKWSGQQPTCISGIFYTILVYFMYLMLYVFGR